MLKAQDVTTQCEPTLSCSYWSTVLCTQTDI